MTADVERTEQVVVSSPAEEVWDLLADFGSIALWAPNVNHSCLTTTQGQDVGAVRRVQVGRNALLERIVVWEPGQTLGYVIEGLPPLLGTVTNTWKLTGQGDTTTVALTTSMATGSAPPKKLAGRALVRPLGQASVQMLDGLRQHLENRS